MSEQNVYLAIPEKKYVKPIELKHLGLKVSTVSKYCADLYKAGMLLRQKSEVKEKGDWKGFEYKSRQAQLDI